MSGDLSVASNLSIVLFGQIARLRLQPSNVAQHLLTKANNTMAKYDTTARRTRFCLTQEMTAVKPHGGELIALKKIKRGVPASLLKFITLHDEHIIGA